jgi:hypothetical protein
MIDPSTSNLDYSWTGLKHGEKGSSNALVKKIYARG